MYPHELRLASLRIALETAGLGGAVLSQPQHVFYFTGFLPGPAPHYLVIAPQRAAAVGPAPIPGWETILYSSYDIHHGWDIPNHSAATLEEAINAVGLTGKALGAELPHLTAHAFATLSAQRNTLHDLSHLLWSLRRIKDPAEIAQIKANVAANDHMFGLVQQAIQPGVSEYDLWGRIYTEMCRANGGPITLEADLGVGPRGANPDAKPGPYLVERGDAVFVDVYSCQHGYYADTTRVFFTAEPTPKQREVYGILLEALVAGEEALRPGVRACDVDAAVRGVIAKAGYGENFYHHSGHAYGVFQQEKPYLIPAETTTLEAGMILTLEPGIYLPGWGGMRLESNYLISQGGLERLDNYPNSIAIPGIAKNL